MGAGPFFHYPQDDEDFIFSVFRSFAPNADDIRVTFTHFSELNLVVLRRVFLALVGAGLERRGRTSGARIGCAEVMAGRQRLHRCPGGCARGHRAAVAAADQRDQRRGVGREFRQREASHQLLTGIPGLQHPRDTTAPGAVIPMTSSTSPASMRSSSGPRLRAGAPSTNASSSAEASRGRRRRLEGNRIQPCSNGHKSSRYPAAPRLHEEETFSVPIVRAHVVLAAVRQAAPHPGPAHAEHLGGSQVGRYPHDEG